MQNTNESRYRTDNPFCDALRFLCDASYAIWPRDVAHRMGEFEKNVWGALRWVAEKNIEWTDECVRAGDRLREEWRREGRASSASTPTGGVGPEC